YTSLNNLYQKNPTNENKKKLLQKEQDFFGTTLARTADNKIKMPIEANQALYRRLEEKYYSKTNLSADQIRERNKLEKELFGKDLQRDGNITTEEEQWVNRKMQTFDPEKKEKHNTLKKEYYANPNLTVEQRKERNNLEEELFGKILLRDGNLIEEETRFIEQ